MVFKKAVQIAALPIVLFAVTTAAEAATTNSSTAGAWWVNVPSASGTIVGISSVAAQIQLSSGATRTFSISNHEYHQLRGLVGMTVRFRVDHNVFHALSLG